MTQADSLSAQLSAGSVDLALLVSVISVVVAAIGAVLIYIQLRKNHDWNRRRAAHDLLFGPYLSNFFPQYEYIRSKVNIFDKGFNYANCGIEFNDSDKIKIDQTLNFLENVCVLMRDNAVDEDVIYKSMGSLIPNYHRFMKPYIDSDRASLNPLLWIYLDEYAENWSARGKARIQEGNRGLLAKAKARI